MCLLRLKRIHSESYLLLYAHASIQHPHLYVSLCMIPTYMYTLKPTLINERKNKHKQVKLICYKFTSELIHHFGHHIIFHFSVFVYNFFYEFFSMRTHKNLKYWTNDVQRWLIKLVLMSQMIQSYKTH